MNVLVCWESVRLSNLWRLGGERLSITARWTNSGQRQRDTFKKCLQQNDRITKMVLSSGWRIRTADIWHGRKIRVPSRWRSIPWSLWKCLPTIQKLCSWAELATPVDPRLSSRLVSEWYSKSREDPQTVKLDRSLNATEVCSKYKKMCTMVRLLKFVIHFSDTGWKMISLMEKGGVV